MKTTKRRELLLALVTAPDLKSARKMARAALARKLVACVNLVPDIESHYIWQGKVETGTEVLMILKTTQARARELEDLILAVHPYDTPEFVLVAVDHAAHRYAAWWRAAVRPAR